MGVHQPANRKIRQARDPSREKGPSLYPDHASTPPKKRLFPIETTAGQRDQSSSDYPCPGTDTIRVALYDNGEIDGDSVSLFINGRLLVQHVRLTADAKVLLIPIDKSLSVNRLVLFAENLGKLPPNTALMEVTIHGKTYNLFLSTDYRKNASVEFNLQE